MNQSLALRQKMRAALLSTTGLCVASLMAPAIASAEPLNRISGGEIFYEADPTFAYDIIVENTGSRLHGNTARFVNGSQLTVDDHAQVDFQSVGVGYDETGATVKVTNGGRFLVSSDLLVGQIGNGHGKITVDGQGSLVDVGGNLVMYSNSFLGSEAVIRNGGELKVGGTIFLNYDGTRGSTLWIGGNSWNAPEAAGVLNAPEINMEQQSGVIFNHTGRYEYAGSIVSGEAAYLSAQRGHTILSGDNSNFTGYVYYYNGATLEINGAFGGRISLGNGNLSGTGTVARVEIHPALSGIVRPQAATPTIGTLSIGDWSIVQVEVDPELGRSGTFNVAGKATIGQGAELHHISGRSANYRRSNSYVLIKAAGGVEGKFDYVYSDYAFLDISLDYTETQVVMNLDRNDIRFTDVAQTANQLAVASAIEDITANQNLSDLVIDLSDDGARSAFTQMAGELHASARSAMLMDAANLRQTVTGSVDQAGGSHGVWGRALTSGIKLDGRDGQAELKSETAGFIAGADKAFGDALRAGVMAGFETAEMKSEGLGKVKRDSQHLGVYGRGDWGKLNVQAGAIASWHALSSERGLAFGEVSENLKGDYDASSEQVYVEAAWAVSLGSTTVSPYASLAYNTLDVDGVSEKGGVAALNIDASDQSLTTTGLGIAVSKSWVRGNGRSAYLSARLGWEAYSGDLDAVQNVAFVDSADFAITGLPLGEDATVAGIGVSIPVGKAGTVSLDWSGLKGSDESRNTAALSYRLSF